MRKIIAILGGPVVGMDSHDALLVNDSDTDEQINQMVYDLCVEHYNSYGYEGNGDDRYAEEFGDDVEMEYDFHWEDYDPTKHDIHKAGGGSFRDDFDRMAAWDAS